MIKTDLIIIGQHMQQVPHLLLTSKQHSLRANVGPGHIIAQPFLCMSNYLDMLGQ